MLRGTGSRDHASGHNGCPQNDLALAVRRGRGHCAGASQIVSWGTGRHKGPIAKRETAFALSRPARKILVAIFEL
jgi:hypothetical protein